MEELERILNQFRKDDEAKVGYSRTKAVEKIQALISEATKAARIEELNSAVQYWEKHDKLASYYIDRLAALRVASLTKED